jgi:hypothetical protein
MPEEAVAEFGKNVPMKRPGQPVELPTAYVMLADPMSSYVSGATIAVTGGEAAALSPPSRNPARPQGIDRYQPDFIPEGDEHEVVMPAKSAQMGVDQRPVAVELIRRRPASSLEAHQASFLLFR